MVLSVANPHPEVRPSGKVQNATFCNLPLDMNSEQDCALDVIYDKFKV
jgi:hypothetical protein